MQEGSKNSATGNRDASGAGGSEGPDQLKEVIRISRLWCELDAEHAKLESTLSAEGDGLPLTALWEECAEADLDQIAAREQTLQNEMKDLHNRLRQ